MLPNWKFTGSGFLLAVFFAWFIELIYGLTAEAALVPGLRTFTLLWFASGAAFFVGTVGGFLFGVPKLAKSLLEPTLSAEKTEINQKKRLYNVNTNLEDISDWLTKIILGLGLVHLNRVINFIGHVGELVGTAIGQAQGAKAIAISAMVYGFVSGFLLVYIWTRTELKREFEGIENA